MEEQISVTGTFAAQNRMEDDAARPGIGEPTKRRDPAAVANHRERDGLTELAKQAGAADPQLLGSELGVLYEGAGALATSLDDPSPWAKLARRPKH